MLIQFANVRSLLARLSLITGACLVLAACRGGSSLPSAVPNTSDSAVSASHSMSQHASIPVTVDLVVPVGKAALLRRLGESNPFFVAFGTKGAKVVAFAHGDRTMPLGTVVANVAAGSSVCTQGAARVCALALTVQATGKDDFVITTYDQSPSGGVIPGGAHQLAAGVDVAKIESKGKTLNAVVGGVVASTSLYLSLGAVSSIDATNFSAIVRRSRRGRKRNRDRQVRKRDGNEGQSHAELECKWRHVLSIPSVHYHNRGERACGDGKL